MIVHHLNNPRAGDWGDIDPEVDIEVRIRIIKTYEKGPMLAVENSDGILLFRSEPRLLREVEDSSRYFTLAVPVYNSSKVEKRYCRWMQFVLFVQHFFFDCTTIRSNRKYFSCC